MNPLINKDMNGKEFLVFHDGKTLNKHPCKLMNNPKN